MEHIEVKCVDLDVRLGKHGATRGLTKQPRMKREADTLRVSVVHKKDGKWHGGFYEWISTSRTTRNWANIKGKYKGWKWEEIPNVAEAAFVIISKDGKKRTNVLKGTWKK